MTPRPLLTPHGRASVLILSRRVGQALAERALDPTSALPHPVRAALADLVVAVDVAACRRVGIEPPTGELRAQLAATLPRGEEARPP